MARVADDLVAPPVVAEHLGVPLRTLGQWRYLGTGPKFLKIGRHVRYRWRDVEAWLITQTRASTQSAAPAPPRGAAPASAGPAPTGSAAPPRRGARAHPGRAGSPTNEGRRPVITSRISPDK
jgi:hypothetical protein